LLISAFASFRNCNGGNLVIFGEGELLSVLKEFALSLGVCRYVHFMGFVENPFRFSEHADLYVLCSKYEGYPNALLEALVSGVSVVATDCESGPREILTEKLSERLSPVGDAKNLAFKMDRFVGNCVNIDAFDHVSLSSANILEEYCMLLEVK
jgi:glycosyltransferase involved in cell wall biosynthesis